MYDLDCVSGFMAVLGKTRQCPSGDCRASTVMIGHRNKTQSSVKASLAPIRPRLETKGARDWTRRDFLSAVGGATAASTVAAGGLTSGCANLPQRITRGETRRKQIVLLATEVRTHSHAQHFIDRFLEGYGWQGRWYHPSVDLVALYVDQFPERDLARDRSRRFNVPIYPTVEEALTRGGSKLAVD